MITTCLLALALQDPASAPELLRRLADESPEVREEATDALYQLGEAVEPLLRRHAREGTNPEVTARVREVLARLARDRALRTFKGGPEVSGLSARLSAVPGKDGGVDLKLEIMNVGTVPTTLVPVSLWDHEFPGRSSRSSGSHAKLVVTSRTPPASRRMSITMACGGRPPRHQTVRLLPGECRTFALTLGTNTGIGGKLPPGEYDVHVVYFANSRSLVAGAKKDLDSTTVKVRID